MTGQLELLDRPQAHKTDPITSIAADFKNKVYSRQSQAGKALRAVAKLMEANASEVDVEIGWRVTTAGRRIPELIEAGYLKLAHTVRPTDCGAHGQAVRLTERGRQWVRG